MAPLKKVKSLSIIAENTIVHMISKITIETDDEDERYKIYDKLQAYFWDHTNGDTSDMLLKSCCEYFDRHRKEIVLAVAVRVVLHRDRVKIFKPCENDYNILEQDRRLARDTIVGISEFLFR